MDDGVPPKKTSMYFTLYPNISENMKERIQTLPQPSNWPEKKSFGNYFKENAIEFAWEFLVDRAGLDGGRMWVTIFREDDEAGELWQKIVGVPPDRILRCDEKDNFWSMGDTGKAAIYQSVFISG